MAASADVQNQVHALRYETLDLKLQELAAQVKLLKKEQTGIAKSMLQYCLDNDKDKISTESMNLLVSQSVGQASLSVPLLRKVFESFFPRRPDIAEKLLAAVQQYRKESVPDRVRLKRVMRRDAGSNGSSTAPSSAL
jgi:hypothetical protein